MSEKKPVKLEGVRAKLDAHKTAASDEASVKSKTLPKSKVDVAIPGFINHGAWMRAQRLAGGDTAKAQAAFVAEVTKFEGEKLNITEMTELCDAQDVLFLIGMIFGDDDTPKVGNDQAIQ